MLYHFTGDDEQRVREEAFKLHCKFVKNMKAVTSTFNKPTDYICCSAPDSPVPSTTPHGC